MARKSTRTAASGPAAEPAAEAVPEPRSMYAKTVTDWAAGQGEVDQPQSGRMGDEETASAAEPVHAVGGTVGLSGGTTSN